VTKALEGNLRERMEELEELINDGLYKPEVTEDQIRSWMTEQSIIEQHLIDELPTIELSNSVSSQIGISCLC
jgi:hypothetical protein